MAARVSAPEPCLDWSDRSIHHLARPARCRVCGQVAHLRDGQGRACHKVCAERELDAELARRGLPWVPPAASARRRRRAA